MSAAGPHAGSPGAVRHWLRAHPADVIDVFVSVVVLDFAVEFLPSVISESFRASLLTSLVLKAVLELVLRLKSRIVIRLRAAAVPTKRVAPAG